MTENNSSIIGEEPCQIEKIVEVILKEPVALTKLHLSEITLSLGTPYRFRKNVTENLNGSNYTIFDAMEDILREWKERKSHEATLYAFIEHLCSCDLNHTAYRLEKHFWAIQSVLALDNNGSGRTQHINVAQLYAGNPFIDQGSNPFSVQLTDDQVGLSTNQEIPMAEPLMNSSSYVNYQPVIAQGNTEDESLQNEIVAQSSAHHPSIDQKLHHFSVQITDDQDITSTEPLMRRTSSFVDPPPSEISEDFTKKNNFHEWLYALVILILLLFSTLFLYLDKINLTKIVNANATLSERVSSVSNSHNVLNASEGSGNNLHWDQIQNRTSLKKPIVLSGRNETEVLIRTHRELDQFFDSQTNWDNVVRIEFDNTLGLICQKDDILNVSVKAPSDFRRYLPNLGQLVLIFPDHCDYLFDKILAMFPKNQFVGFQYLGEVNDDTERQIHEFLHRNNNSLQEINITGVLRTSSYIFEIRNTIVLNFVRRISLDLEEISDTGISSGIITDRFCPIFPNLAKLEVQNVSISLYELFKLQKCSKLESLSAFIIVDKNDIIKMEQTNWRDNFPLLSFLSLKLEFKVCPAFEFFEKLSKNADMLPKYKLCSNCIWSENRHERCHSKSKPG